jgi:hypothetical protein
MIVKYVINTPVPQYNLISDLTKLIKQLATIAVKAKLFLIIAWFVLVFFAVVYCIANAYVYIFSMV